MNDGFRETALGPVLRWLFLVGVVVFLAAPSMIVVPMSFSSGELMKFPPDEFSLRWYAHYFTSLEWQSATRASLIIGVLTTIVSVTAATLAAYGTMQLSPRLRGMVAAVVVLPALIPVILIATGLFFVLARLGLNGTIAGLVLGHSALAIPVAFVVMAAGFSQFDFTHDRAARSMGASWLQSWRHVILPQMTGSIIAASLLAFVTSLDEVVIAMFVSSGANATLPKVMFTALRDKIEPTIAVISTGLLVVASLAVYISIKKGSYGK
jgi:putative spermidine/putrescine transport system permease protein